MQKQDVGFFFYGPDEIEYDEWLGLRSRREYDEQMSKMHLELLRRPNEVP